MVDHIDGRRGFNLASNLRLSTASNNSRNRRPYKDRSGELRYLNLSYWKFKNMRNDGKIYYGYPRFILDGIEYTDRRGNRYEMGEDRRLSIGSSWPWQRI